MADGTKIEWTDATWSPVTGCTRVSEGCLNCYIERTVPFRVEHRKFSLPIVGGTTGVRLHPERLEQPLHWRKPRKVFVCSMADLFHDDVPDEYIAKVFAVMSQAPHCTFQVLTKRPARMRSLLRSDHFQSDAHSRAIDLIQNRTVEHPVRWPMPNVWIGTSVENQKWADIRVPILLDTPAAVRWLSCEPLLGPVDMHLATTPWDEAGIDWVVVGGESGPPTEGGPGVRPMHPRWALSIRDFCQAAGIPFLYKQTGDWAPQDVERYSDLMPMAGDGRACVVEPDGRVSAAWSMGGRDAREGSVTAEGAPMLLVGKKRAGRELDGRTWDEYPDTQGVEFLKAPSSRAEVVGVSREETQ